MGAEPRLIAAVTCLLSGHLLLGVSHIAMLPPWEGFDETAHYSYLQQLADTGTLPQLGSAKMSAAVERYARLAPIRYSSVAPVEQNGGLTYRTFFESPAVMVARGKAIVHGHPPESRR